MNKTLHILSITLLSLNIASLASNDNNNNNLIINNNNSSSSSNNNSDSTINSPAANLIQQFLTKIEIDPTRVTLSSSAYFRADNSSRDHSISMLNHIEKETLIPAQTIFTKVQEKDANVKKLIHSFVITRAANNLVAQTGFGSSKIFGNNGCTQTTFNQACQKLYCNDQHKLRQVYFNLMDDQPQTQEQFVSITKVKNNSIEKKAERLTFSALKEWLINFKKNLANEKATLDAKAFAQIHKKLFDDCREKITQNRSKTQEFIAPGIEALTQLIEIKNNNTNNQKTTLVRLTNAPDEQIAGECIQQ